MDVQYFFELFLSGLTRGSIYALIAIGYTMVYGIIELINFAHGEIYMIGAFTGLIVAGILGTMGFPLPAILVLAVLVSMIYCAGYGYTIEKIAYKPLRQAGRLSPLISAIGMSLFLQNYVILVQTSDFVPFPSLIPEFAFLEPIAHIFASSDFLIVVVSAVLMAGLTLFIKYTKMGKAMRATAQNRKMAMLLGVDADRVISVTFIIGSALAAVGGVLIASHVGMVNFAVGFLAGIKAFTAAVLGGIGSLPGAMLGGLFLGLSESFGAGYISSDYEDVFAFSLLVIFLIFRPSGIMGKAKVEKV
ncbi:branched-chain amino acid ABC transporter permease [Thermodesulfomicrobium sp. WS]|uniref:branched-chain amino acid ABC transporter permease n=1 Tax=Thermodesulfomicrobium sp. WS TaxID=3004129 RepID=UPI002491DF41|nr:branched-chain amino acid ABC transporter permease LivH [Thermodesulfomicrobium sp. WS]BDV00987.1 branched-chain amino acid ABC transporter permease [Thermodesulfomicrobium sp. WS]